MPEADTRRESEILQAESFLSGVYDKTQKWLADARSAQVKTTFDATTVEEWRRQSTHPGAEVTLGMDLKKAVILIDGVNIYGIVLGKRHHILNDQGESPSLLFGFLPNTQRMAENSLKESAIEGLRLLVSDAPFHNRRAEFYFRTDLHKMDVNCWIDAHQYGGAGLSRWEIKDNAMSTKGEKAMLDTVKRLVRNYDPI